MQQNKLPNSQNIKQSERGSDTNQTVRIDRWLWSARFYKTRAIATDAVKKGHIQLNSLRTKPAKLVHIDDELRIRKNQEELVVIVNDLSSKRLGAPLAQKLYSETKDSKERRLTNAENRKLISQGLRHQHGKPNKKDRRDLIKQKYQQT